MNSVLRSLALTLGTTLSLAGCSNSSESAGDVLAEDTTLAREVLAARGDTLGQPVDTAFPEAAPEAASEVAAAPPNVEAAPIIEAAPVSRPISEKPRAAISETKSTRRTAARRVVTSNTRRISSSGRVRPRSSVERIPMRSSAMIPAGLELAIASDQRVCASMSRVGDTFAAHVAENVVGPIGVVIPKGATALARVVANNGNVEIDVERISVGNRNYPVHSLVTYTEMEKVKYKSSSKRDRCIPDDGDITARIVAPLKIALSD